MVLSKVLDFDLRKFLCRILDEIAENGLLVVAFNDDFADARDFGDGYEAMPDDRMACDFKERLRGGLASFTKT